MPSIQLVGALILTVVMLSFFVLFLQLKYFARYWHKLAQKPKSANALVYVAMGDSTAQGIGALWPRYGYVGRLARSLGAQYGRPVHVINISKSGAKLEDCINEQLPKLRSLSPDYLTIEIGANDMAVFEQNTFTKQIDELFSKLPAGAVVSDMPYFGLGRFKKLETNVLAANKIIHKLATRHNLQVAPLHKLTEQRASVITLAIDFLHPSNVGYKNWHDAFWSVLKHGQSVILRN